jgi:phosphoglycolate phosphatase-like HAD superfamily hydrolase
MLAEVKGLSSFFDMDEIIVRQRNLLRRLMELIVTKYGNQNTPSSTSSQILQDLNTKSELDVQLLAAIMHILALLQDEIEDDDDIQVILEELEDINESVMEIAEKMKI